MIHFLGVLFVLIIVWEISWLLIGAAGQWLRDNFY